MGTFQPGLTELLFPYYNVTLNMSKENKKIFSVILWLNYDWARTYVVRLPILIIIIRCIISTC